MTLKSIEQLLSSFRPGHLSDSDQQTLLSLVEFLCGEWVRQKEEIQLLRDEINRLKGEDGKPKISGRNQKETTESEADDSRDISSEQNRRKRGMPRKARLVKFDKDRVADETIVLDFEDRSHLPNDVEFKGYATSH